MPNWCNNYAHITCPSKDIYINLNTAITNNTWFETFAPLSITDETNEMGWDLSTAVNTWSTKWPPSNIEIINTDDENYIIELSFDTAWYPPLGVYKIMNKKFDIDIHAYYEEWGCAFFGRLCLSKEEEIDDMFDMPTNSEELNKIREIIGCELDDYMLSCWTQLKEQWEEEDAEEESNEEESNEEEIVIT